jgi:branched-chain amino acid transport system ATP-binding protein
MPEPLLDIRSLKAFYGDFQALFDISLAVPAGEVVSFVGANGAGKSTLLKSIAGLMPGRRDAIVFAGEEIGDKPAYEVAKRGIALVPEGRRLFPSLSVEENLMIGGQLGREGPWSLARIYELFPVLFERRHVSATSLSGGQQQMCAIGRALMSNPRLLMCDEISLGLAPIVVRDIYARLPQIAAAGITLIVVEQDVAQALKAADHVYCLQEGRVVLHGKAGEVTREAVSAAYFGV